MSETLSPERWRRLSSILDEALDLPEEEREPFLARACGDDADLRRRAAALLAAERRAERFLAAPVGERYAELLTSGESDDDATAAAGLRIGPYRLISELGRGGMGVVHLAERADGQFEQRVALKLIKRGLDTEEIQARFRRERQILARLRHPCIAGLLDGGVTDDGRPWFAMEYVDGERITAYCDRMRLPIEGRLRLFRRACRAVEHAHRSLVVHRDLKPSNIMVTAGGDVKLLDFGIARLLQAEDGTEATATRQGDLRLTPDYAAPEQIRGEPATTAVDVYALGVVLCEMLAGERPYRLRGGTLPEIASAVLGTPATLPSRLVADAAGERRGTTAERLRRRLRGDLDTIVLTALRKEPARRYASAEALGLDIDRHLAGQPIAARKDSLRYRARKFAGRNRIGVAAGALVLLSIVAGLAGTIWQARTAAREARIAREVKDFLVGIFEVSDPSQARGEAVTARELLDAGARRVETELSGDPAVQADLTAVLAGVYEKLGLHEQALPLADRTVGLQKRLHGADHPEVATALRLRGLILHGMGKYDEAETSLRRALAIHERSSGGANAEVAEDLENLAIVLRSRGDLDQAEALVRRTLAIRRRLHGGDDPEVATALNNLAVMLREKGKFDEALPLYEKALAIRRARLGPDHPDVAVTLNNEAALLREMGRLDEAERAAREGLELDRRLYGDDNVNTITSSNNLAAILQSQGDYDEAEQLDRAVLDFWRRTAGEDHPNAVVSLNNLATVLKEKGDYAQAEPMFRSLVDAWRRLVGEEHPYMAVGLTHLGAVMREEGKYDEAEALFRKALAIRIKVNGKDHPEVATVRYHLARLAHDRGDYETALRLHRQALATREAALGREHRLTAQSLAALGATLSDAGSPAEGIEQLRAALDIAHRVYPAGHPDLAAIDLDLGRALTALGRWDEAGKALDRALDIRRERFGETSWLTAEVQLRRGECLAAQGRIAEARPLLTGARRILAAQRGRDHPLARAAAEALRKLPPS